MNFETATDLELEQALACLVYKCEGWKLSKTGGSFCSCGIDGSTFYVQPIPKYCTDISATWPLMIEHGVSVNALSGGDYKAFEIYEKSGLHGNDIADENGLLRAVVVCLIKVLESKHERT
ncbi:hypothetical protein NMS84_001399 [Vibrio cholerae]|nr:hypothetical protein [Vibrio cholerae]